MSTVRKRKWRRGDRELSAFVVDYVDGDGRRRLQTFKTEQAANAFKAALAKSLTLDHDREAVPVAPARALDLLWGTEAIADFIGRKPRDTYHLLQRRALPAKKVGRLWVASKARLTTFFEAD
jgi:hypothetical protein